MKTFTRTLAALFAVSLAALALSACKKVQPTELTASTSTATVIKGTVAYLPNNSDGVAGTSYLVLSEGADVTIVAHIPTGETKTIEKVVDGKTVYEEVDITKEFAQTVPVVDKYYTANLPVPAGKVIKVDITVQFEKANQYGKVGIGEGAVAKTGTMKYGVTKSVEVRYGQIFVANLEAVPSGFEASSDKGVGGDSSKDK